MCKHGLSNPEFCTLCRVQEGDKELEKVVKAFTSKSVSKSKKIGSQTKKYKVYGK